MVDVGHSPTDSESGYEHGRLSLRMRSRRGMGSVSDDTDEYAVTMVSAISRHTLHTEENDVGTSPSLIMSPVRFVCVHRVRQWCYLARSMSARPCYLWSKRNRVVYLFVPLRLPPATWATHRLGRRRVLLLFFISHTSHACRRIAIPNSKSRVRRSSLLCASARPCPPRFKPVYYQTRASWCSDAPIPSWRRSYKRV